MEMFERYKLEIEEDLKIDEFNIKEASLKAPARKHFWVSRLIGHKRNLLKLQDERDKLKKKVIKELQMQSPVKLGNISLEKATDDSDLVRSISLQIEEEKLIIEFLEKTEKTFSSLTYDIKNIVEVMKLEQL